MDELYDRDPEPCDTCRIGISLFVCYDGVRRCRRCVREYADARGWNELVIPHIPKKRKRGPDPNQRVMKGLASPPKK